jgi:hypothetical protein
MSKFEEVKFALRRVFAQVYSITTFGILSSMIIGYFTKELMVSLMNYGTLGVVSIIFVLSLVRSMIRVRNFVTFFLSKCIDGFFFSIVFIMIMTGYGSMYDLFIATLCAFILFIISAISSLFITKDTYSAVIFTTKVVTISYVFLSLVDLILYIFSYRILFITNIFGFVGIILSSLLVSLINRSIISNPNVNVWYVGDMFSQTVVYVIRQIFFLIIMNRDKK